MSTVYESSDPISGPAKCSDDSTLDSSYQSRGDSSQNGNSSAQRQDGQSRRSGSGFGSAQPPTLVRQDAFNASGSPKFQEEELRRVGLCNAPTRSTPQDQDRPSYNAPHEPPRTTTALYELGNGATQGSTDSSYAAHDQQHRAMHSNGHHDKPVQ